MSLRRTRVQKRRAALAGRRWRWDWRLPLFLGAVFAVKAAVLSQLQHHPVLEPDGGVDAAAYVRLAHDVLAGDVALGPRLYYLSPLYIYFLSAALAISDSFTVVRVVQIALGTVAVWCVFLAARIWFGVRAAWIAATLAVLTGLFTFYEILILQASLDTFLTAAALACLAYALAIPARGNAAPPTGGSSKLGLVGSAFRRKDLWAGVLFGLQTLNRPNVAIAVAGVVVTLAIVRRWRAAVWLAGGIAIAVAPVVARNAIVSHQIALSSSHGGLNFYIGNNAAATGQYASVPGVRGNVEGQSEDTRTVAEQAVGHPLTDTQVSRISRPSHSTGFGPTRWAAALFARKLALVFNARHQWLDFSYPYYAYDTGSSLGLLFVGPWLLVPLGLAGMTIGLLGGSHSPQLGETGDIRDRGYVAWFVFVPFYAIGVAVFFVAERYRLPLFVPLCICSGGAIDRLLQALLNPSSAPRLAGSAAIAAALCGAVLTAWPFPLNNGRYDERLMLAKVLMNRREYGAAAVELQRAHELQPDNTVTEFNLGIALVSAERESEASPICGTRWMRTCRFPGRATCSPTRC